MSQQVKGPQPSDLCGQPYEITAFQRDAAQPVAEAASACYTEVMSQWEFESGLRTQFRFPESGDEPGKEPWSRNLVPMADDPRIQERWETVGTPLLRQHHDRFQNFTYHLELMAVTPVSHRIAVGDMPIKTPLALRRDALRIGMDEGLHAMYASQLMAQAEATWGPAVASVGRPGFLRVLREELAKLSNERLRALGEAAFVVVSETLITGALSGLPKDASVHSSVRAVLAEHHREEAFHHGVYSRFLRVLWSQLDAADRSVIGPLFARFIRAFLDSDVQTEIAWLCALGYARATAQDIVKESEWRTAARRVLAAAPTIRHLRGTGVLDTRAAEDELQLLQLI